MKLKTIIPMLLAAAISVAGFQACKQANLKPEGLQMNSHPQGNNITNIPCEPYSADNPFDSVGIKHNATLEDVRTSVSFYNSTFNQRINRAFQFISQQYGITSSFTVTQITNIVADSSNSFNGVINGLSISNNLRNRLRNLILLIKNSSNFDNYCSLKNEILLLEEAALNDNNLSAEEKNVFLRVASIARHTLYYWTQKYMEVTGYDANDPSASQTERSKRPWWKWAVVVLCDVAGGIAGASGGVAGVIGGAVGGSAGAAGFVDWIAPPK
jgi:hypothetical protein